MLRALSGPLAGATFEVGPRVLIGRVAACDVHLVDVEVSREHAMIVSQDGRPTLVDLDSRNGTFMSGELVRRVPLQPGDTFTIGASEFSYDRAAPISTSPVLSAHFGLKAPGAPLQREDSKERPTREMTAARSTDAVEGSEPADPAEERQTQRSLAAEEDDPAKPAPVARPTVQLEAATPASPNKDTVQIHAAEAPGDPEVAAGRPTVSMAAVASQPRSDPPESPPNFAPPPVPTERTAAPRPKKKSRDTAYDGDLLADVTAYRSFRLRLQRGEIPSGDEVAAMIDLEAQLREPRQTDLRRDVVSKRFFRRFPFVAKLQARFNTSGRLVNAEGTMTNLSADGLQCALELGDFSPTPEQLAMLVIESSHNGVAVRYSVTARVVWSQMRVAGFVFAGVPSSSERRADFDEMETVIRVRPRGP